MAEPPRGAGMPRGRRRSASEGRVAALVDLLRRAEAGLSGAEIGRRIGVSRAAVWKHVARLRQDGYRIEGTPSRGYRLVESADRLTPAELGQFLTSKTLGSPVRYFEEVDSTNRVARDLGREGAGEGLAVLADAQTAGRGRLGRSWVSPARRNLYMSVLLRPPVPPARAPRLALLAASAVVAAIEATAAVRASIKWPNDVLIGGRKVAGILTEMESEGDRVRFVVVGIGVNLNLTKRELDPTIRATATSLLAETGDRVGRARFAAQLLAELEERYGRYLLGDDRRLRLEWESHSCLTGRVVTVQSLEGRRRGRVLGVDEDGALRLRADDGEAMRVLAGDVTLHGEYAARREEA